MRKTVLFVLGGAGMLMLGAAVQPRFTSRAEKPAADRVLFPDLSDASKAASLEIVKYDEGLATLAPFKVVQAGGVWVLPSHQNYPADAGHAGLDLLRVGLDHAERLVVGRRRAHHVER
ncbi:MAG: hypothetical protein EBR28_10100, partial [Planctomycetia bacterium]|nr:hypothetical protein [Planctomycetia bacterium]